MSTVQPTDKTLVNRAGVDHSALADMSTVQDTDLLLINRAGVDYKCTFLDWKNSQSKAPNVGAVTLADVAGGSRFTSVSFPVSATMTEDGTPLSTKKLKAYAEGALKTAAVTGGITTVGTGTPPTAYSYWLGNTPTDAWAVGAPNIATIGTPLGAASGSVMHLHVNGPGSRWGLLPSSGGGPTGGVLIEVSSDGITYRTQIRYGPTNDANLKDILIEGPYARISRISVAETFNAEYWAVWSSSAYTTLTVSDPLSGIASGDVVTEVTAGGAAGDATGTVYAADMAAKTIQLAVSAGTWDVGSKVKGPPKVPAGGASVKLYCVLDAAGAVSDLQSADPGFTVWGPAGTGPYTGAVKFPATLPTGNAPDTDLPAGTTITVEVQATNTAGTDSAKSNVLTPA